MKLMVEDTRSGRRVGPSRHDAHCFSAAFTSREFVRLFRFNHYTPPPQTGTAAETVMGLDAITAQVTGKKKVCGREKSLLLYR